MPGALFEYYYAVRVGILALILLLTAIVAVFWLFRRRWQNRAKTLEQALADCQSAHFEKLQGDLQRLISHEYGKGLNHILNKSTETFNGLGSDQLELREKQSEIIATAEELDQHATNILFVFAPDPDKLKIELVNLRKLVANVLLELNPYAVSKGVIVRADLQDLEPLFLDPRLTALAIRNLVHNAIKYSPDGRVVEIWLKSDMKTAMAGKAIVFTVKDYGPGITKELQEQLFTLNFRDDGLVETGNGLGLYLARNAARLQGGDVILVSSVPNEGTVFQLTLPATLVSETTSPDKDGLEEAFHKRFEWRWVAAAAGLIGLLAVLLTLFKPPQGIQLITDHNGSDQRYVRAQGEQDSWGLTQVPTPDACTQFRPIRRGDKVALLTCNNRFVTAPWIAASSDLVTQQHSSLWRLRQIADLSECGLFGVEVTVDDKVALRTCTGSVVTAGDGGWPDEMAWALVAETDKIDLWEKFRLETP